MEKLRPLINTICPDNKEAAKDLYILFANLQQPNNNELQEILPDVYKLISEGLIKKDILFISTINNISIQQELIKYETKLPLDVSNSTSLFTQQHYNKHHWLQTVLTENFDITPFGNQTINDLIILKLIKATNLTSPINLKNIRNLLHLIKPEQDELITAYINEIKHIVNTVDFLTKSPDCSNALFFDINEHSLLETLSNNLDFNLCELWDEILRRLEVDFVGRTSFMYNMEYGDAYSDVESFIGFTLMHNLIKCVKLCKSNSVEVDIARVIDSTKNQLCGLQNRTLQVELMENCFALCFLRDANGVFICGDMELRTVLLFLRGCFECCLRSFARDSGEFARLQRVNKFVSDALWRLETVGGVKDFSATGASLMEFMLAEPEGMIQLCLKRGQFEKARQVIQLFNLQDTALTKSILFTERMNNLRAKIKKTQKIRMYYTAQATNIKDIPTLITDFKKTEENQWQPHDIFDLTLTLPFTQQDTQNILQTESISNLQEHTEFQTKIMSLLEISPEKTIPEILNDPKYDLNIEKYNTKRTYYQNLTKTMKTFQSQLAVTTGGSLNAKHPSHKTFMKLHELIKDDTKYLPRVFNYLKSLAKICHIDGNNADVVRPGAFFNLLDTSRSELIGRLIHDRKLDPYDFEQLAARLKIDLLYHVAFNCIPQIRLDAAKKDNVIKEPDKLVFAYVAKRNWLLGFLVAEIFKIEGARVEVTDEQLKYFRRYFGLGQFDFLQEVFDGNRILAGLDNGHARRVVGYLNRNVFHEVDLQGDSLETAEEISEDDGVKGNWRFLLDLLHSVPGDRSELVEVQDRILVNLVNDKFEEEHWRYVEFISGDGVRRDVILGGYHQWPGEFCIDLLKGEISRGCEVDEGMERCLEVVQFCEEVRTVNNFDTWHTVHTTCLNDKETIIKKLLSTPKVHLLLKFATLYDAEQTLREHITFEYIESLFLAKESQDAIDELLSKIGDTQTICLQLLKTLKNIEQLEFILEHIAEKGEQLNYIKNVKIGIAILKCFSANEREQLWCLVDEPLNILEMLIMNTKLDKLGRILEVLKPDLANCEFYDRDISIENIDEMLRKYAEKSLEFRVIIQPHPNLLKGSENKLMQSLDSIYGPDRIMFVMPDSVPDKTEWVPNNEVLECMCCQNTTFSMFNRRHHCRRCGRVVCFNCSTRRMKVKTYDDILVRVCIDCYDQSHADGNMSNASDNHSTVSIIYDYWLFTENPKHNKILRQEFSYEHAPSVSLFLSIMKLHTKNINYPKFLLDQCDNLLRYLQPIAPNGPQEIDYPLVIKMLKSLAIAAKMLSSECHQQWGTSQADRILSQADLLSLLVERGCLNLLPATNNGAPYVDASVLRRLRDKLLEKEQWNFALDVSTKAGLDNSGVFAAWGKSCLKAGCLQLAREKFQRCLDKTVPYDLSEYSQSTELDDSYDGVRRRRYSSKLSTASDSKPQKSPALLNQIIQILEAQTIKFDAATKKDLYLKRPLHSSLSSLKTDGFNDPAVCIRTKLKNLKAIAAGNYDGEEVPTSRLEPVFFHECVYYLGKYGSHLGLLQFYLKHDCLHDALHYVVDNKVSGDVFVEVYLMCLKDGKVDVLQDGMTGMDTTLDIWKDYLRFICSHLEKQSLLNSLYQLQLFMGDFVRAAMTCIRFYKYNVTSYEELKSNIHFLHHAETHLQQELEQQQWVEVNTVSDINAASNHGFEEKQLTNPSLVMKIDSKNINNHISTIKRQIEVTLFLAEQEIKLGYGIDLAASITGNEENKETNLRTQILTLFDTHQEKILLAVLLIIYGENIEGGFRLAQQILHDFKLKPIKVYCQTGRQLAKEGRYSSIAQLVSCIRTTGVNDVAVTDMCDEMLTLAVRTLSTNGAPGAQLETLIKLITDRSMKISIYIETKQLKSAYLLAARHSRYGDIRRILREAELINKPDIKRLCQKLLHGHSHGHS